MADLTTEWTGPRPVRVEYWQGEISRLHDEWLPPETLEDHERRTEFKFTFGGRFALVETRENTMPEGGNLATLAELLWRTHNVDDRPRGREIRSMSMGDVLVFHVMDRSGRNVVETVIARAAVFGWEQVDGRDWRRAPKQTEADAERRLDEAQRRLEDDEALTDLIEHCRTPTAGSGPSTTSSWRTDMDAIRERARERAQKLIDAAIEAGAHEVEAHFEGFNFRPDRRPTTDEAEELARVCALAADHGRRTGELVFHVDRQGRPSGMHLLDPKITPTVAQRRKEE